MNSVQVIFVYQLNCVKSGTLFIAKVNRGILQGSRDLYFFLGHNEPLTLRSVKTDFECNHLYCQDNSKGSRTVS